MKNPFVYGEEVRGETFCDREQETGELLRDIRNGQNVLMFSSRRLGKTSLIKEVLRKAEKEGIITLYIDLYPAITKEYFIQIYAQVVAQRLRGKIEKVIETLKKLFPRLIPKMIIKGEGTPEFEFTFDSKEDLPPIIDSLLLAPKKISSERKKRVVVVFDEFQEIANYPDQEIERRLRSAIQTQREVSYIFLGSKKHLLYNLFENPNRPLYKSCKHLPLRRIAPRDLHEFIKRHFEKGKIKIDGEDIEKIIKLCECHPYYVQFLCHIIWDECVDTGKVTRNTIDSALDKLLHRETVAYTILWDSLTQKQKEVITALSNEKGPAIYSKDFLRKYNLGAASSVQKALTGLIEIGIVERENGDYAISDIFFKRWILKSFRIT